MLPKYARGTSARGMINIYVEPNLDINDYWYNMMIHAPSHELFHIMYKELIYEKENKPRIAWFDEGMAQLFSGEIKKYYLKITLLIGLN